ncbi:hypothetical protein DDE18_15875 [Nocardioides gansuensis]|uniref:Uncharacterized protein n=1 Tax=Nocardioides gansuensis TaxID=2138300 RepID=A0A2T8F6Z8_9ACTN|nr:hypothetical protein DDE18_15875 [Nocardioides gansuensis]
MILVRQPHCWPFLAACPLLSPIVRPKRRDAERIDDCDAARTAHSSDATNDAARCRVARERHSPSRSSSMNGTSTTSAAGFPGGYTGTAPGRPASTAQLLSIVAVPDKSAAEGTTR